MIDGEKITILWYGDSPAVRTGFGRVSYEFLKRLHATGKYIIYALGINDKGDDTPLKRLPNFHIIPCSDLQHDPYGLQKLPEVLSKVQPDVIISLNDIWVWLGDERHGNRDHWLWKHIRQYSPKSRWIGYFPIDGSPLDEEWLRMMKLMHKAVTYSKYGIQIIKDHDPDLDARLIYHGVDCETFNPIGDAMKNEVRKQMNVPEDAFLIGCVSRNQPRKNMPRLLHIFKLFSEGYGKCEKCGYFRQLDEPRCELCGCESIVDIHKGKEDAMLYLHMNLMDSRGYNLPKVMRDFKFKRSIIFRPQHNVAHGVPEQELNNLYNVMDVHMLSTFCFTGDTVVQSEDEAKRIDRIEAGDRVLTSDGTYKEVKEVLAREYLQQIIKVKADGIPEIKCTPEHRFFYVACEDSRDKQRVKKNPVIESISAENLTKYDFLVYPRPKTNVSMDFISIDPSKYTTSHRANGIPKKILLDYDFGKLCGFYLSEGCANLDGLAFSFHTKETDYYEFVEEQLNKLFVGKTRVTHMERNRTTVWYSGRAVGKFFIEMFGSKSHKKKIPSWVLNAPNGFRRGIVEGWCRGDGCLSKNNGSISYQTTTVSQSLAYQMFNLIVAEGFMPSLNSIQRMSMVYRVDVNGQNDFCDYIGIDAPQVNRKGRIFADKNNVYYPISSVTLSDKPVANVYNLTIDSKDHTYVTGCLVHNCEGFGLSVLESMAAGTPNVVTRTTSVTEMIEQGGGFAVRPNDYLILNDTNHCRKHLMDIGGALEALETYYNDRDLLKTHSEKGIAFAKTRDWETLSGKFEDVIQESLNERKMLSNVFVQGKGQRVLFIWSGADAGDALSITGLVNALGKNNDAFEFAVATQKEYHNIFDGNKKISKVIDVRDLIIDRMDTGTYVLQLDDVIPKYLNATVPFVDKNRMKILMDSCGFGRGKVKPVDYKPEYFIAKEEKEWAKKWLVDNGIKDKNVVAICTHGHDVSCQWPGDNWKKLCNTLIKKHNVGIVGFTNDNSMDSMIARIGDMNIRQQIAILNECKILISVDNPLLIFATALKIPVVGMFGPTDPEIETYNLPEESVMITGKKFALCVPCWKPWHSPCRMNGQMESVCMHQLRVGDVYGRMRKLMLNLPNKGGDSDA